VRVLILTASIGEGHDLPARLLKQGIVDTTSGAEVTVADGLRAMGRVLTVVGEDASRRVFFQQQRLYDVVFGLSVRLAPARVAMRVALGAVGSRGMARLVAEHRPDVVVSTYPLTTEVLGWMRRRGSLDVPAVAVITDLASLRFWAAPGIDLHLVTHPESVEEVCRVAGEGAAVQVVRGLVAPEFHRPIAPDAARRALGLPAAGKLVVVSGGGWGVGDLEGALRLALSLPEVAIGACLCGRNVALRERLEGRYGVRPNVVVEGFTARMSDWLAAADVLVHSTAGLTVLEATMRGCPVISYGWGRGHIRLNDRAFRRHRLAAVAHDRSQLRTELLRALDAPRPAPLLLDDLPDAAAVVLALTRERAAALERPG
jgi:processive 1,2-diacylglycerol beta-glucosyltransferase